uniref:Uncharacterized protein n=1 Tax=Knipowitschia caucasica TaxID=637954 RepID=A0AAV2LVY1_KNICA
MMESRLFVPGGSIDSQDIWMTLFSPILSISLIQSNIDSNTTKSWSREVSRNGEDDEDGAVCLTSSRPDEGATEYPPSISESSPITSTTSTVRGGTLPQCSHRPANGQPGDHPPLVQALSSPEQTTVQRATFLQSCRFLCSPLLFPQNLLFVMWGTLHSLYIASLQPEAQLDQHQWYPGVQHQTIHPGRSSSKEK